MSRLMNIIWILILIIMGIVFGNTISQKDATINKMAEDLNNTGHLLTIQIKENQLVYNELIDTIDKNNRLNNIDETDPRALIKLACEKYDLDYRLAISIARLETANFTSDIYKENNNVGGMRVREGQWNRYNSLIQGVNAFVICLKDEYINQGLNTPELMQPKYCPTGDGEHWLEQVKIIMKEEE